MTCDAVTHARHVDAGYVCRGQTLQHRRGLARQRGLVKAGGSWARGKGPPGVRPLSGAGWLYARSSPTCQFPAHPLPVIKGAGLKKK